MERELLSNTAARTTGALREQLSQLTAASQVLEQNATDEKSRRYLAVINHSICRMLRTIGRMELTCRLTGEDEIRAFPEETDLGLWLEELARTLQSVLSRVGVVFTADYPAHLFAYVDAELLRHMLLEQIALAAVSSREVTLTMARQKGSVCFTVRGIGSAAPDGDLAALFDPEGERSDCGMALALQIAQLHGGTLMAQTAPDLSTTAVIPLREGRSGLMLRSPRTTWNSGGFDPVLVALSELLTYESFLPEDLG